VEAFDRDLNGNSAQLRRNFGFFWIDTSRQQQIKNKSVSFVFL
jgi:hypothetical protein